MQHQLPRSEKRKNFTVSLKLYEPLSCLLFCLVIKVAFGGSSRAIFYSGIVSFAGPLETRYARLFNT